MERVAPDEHLADAHGTAARGRLEALLRSLAPVAVAFSGGVDSSLLLAVARRALGDGAIAAIGTSPSLAASELALAREVAALLGAPLCEIPTEELSRPGYAANAGDRCFHCKSELFERLAAHPLLAGRTICDGTHAEDDAGGRPGMRAADERGVRSPLREAGLGKRPIREWARELGLPNWDRPARPCLASRLPVGTAVTAPRLAAVERLEEVLAEAGFRVFRARVGADRVVVELGPDEMPAIVESRWIPALLERARRLGLGPVYIDDRGYGVPGVARLRSLELAPGAPPPGEAENAQVPAPSNSLPNSRS